MFVLDTNVLSAMMKAQIVPEIQTWIARHDAALLYTASVCQAEILAGLSIMPAGRRRFDLEAAAQAMFTEDLAGRVLPFGTEAATVYASLSPPVDGRVARPRRRTS